MSNLHTTRTKDNKTHSILGFCSLMYDFSRKKCDIQNLVAILLIGTFNFDFLSVSFAFPYIMPQSEYSRDELCHHMKYGASDPDNDSNKTDSVQISHGGYFGFEF